MTYEFIGFSKLKQWEDFFHTMLYDPQYRILNPVGTIESELNHIFSSLIREQKSTAHFWNALFNTFNTIPPKQEYINTIYSTICFFHKNIPHIYKSTLKEIIQLGRFKNLKRINADEEDMNDLLLDNLISDILYPDKSLENLISAGMSERNPYYYYLLSKYYYRTNQRRKAGELIMKFISVPETEQDARCFTNCLYALDETISVKVKWEDLVNNIAQNEELYSSDSNKWQREIFKKLIQTRYIDLKKDRHLTDSETGLILLYCYFFNDQETYNSYTAQIVKFEIEQPQANVLSKIIFTEKPSADVPDKIMVTPEDVKKIFKEINWS